MAEKIYKLVVVGDAGCGKTSLITRFMDNKFEHGIKPNRGDDEQFEVRNATIDLFGKEISFLIFNTAGSESMNHCVRQVAYLDTDAVLLCYSVNDQKSLESIETKWYKEVRQICIAAPVLLVATKIDTRNEISTDGIPSEFCCLVDPEKAKFVGKNISAFAYQECSALDGTGAWSVFHTAALAIFDQSNKETSRRESCTVM